jgi:hypothetical protein
VPARGAARARHGAATLVVAGHGRGWGGSFGFLFQSAEDSWQTEAAAGSAF